MLLKSLPKFSSFFFSFLRLHIHGGVIEFCEIPASRSRNQLVCRWEGCRLSDPLWRSIVVRGISSRNYYYEARFDFERVMWILFVVFLLAASLSCGLADDILAFFLLAINVYSLFLRRVRVSLQYAFMERPSSLVPINVNR